jgi:hypothetical protein
LPKVLISYISCSQGAMGQVRTLIEGIGREGCVSCARAKAEGGRPLGVGASYRGSACLCLYHCVLRTLAVKICNNVVTTPDYSRPQCNLNLYNFNITSTIYSYSMRFSPFAWWPPLLFLGRHLLFCGQIDLNLEVCISNSMCTGQ